MPLGPERSDWDVLRQGKPWAQLDEQQRRFGIHISIVKNSAGDLPLTVADADGRVYSVVVARVMWLPGWKIGVMWALN